MVDSTDGQRWRWQLFVWGPLSPVLRRPSHGTGSRASASRTGGTHDILSSFSLATCWASTEMDPSPTCLRRSEDAGKFGSPETMGADNRRGIPLTTPHGMAGPEGSTDPSLSVAKQNYKAKGEKPRANLCVPVDTS